MALKMKYFVLSPSSRDKKHAEASRVAMKAYANVIESQDSQRAQEIREWVARSEKAR